MADPLPLIVSTGEPSGIGPDILLKVWSGLQSGEIEDVGVFAIVGDPAILSQRAKMLGIDFESQICKTPAEVLNVFATTDALPVIPLANKLHGLPATPNSQDSAGIVESIETAVSWIKDRKARAVVTLPINKKSLYDAGFEYPGHTEFLGTLCEKWTDGLSPARPVMMLAGPDLRAVPVTIHIPLKDVPSQLTTQDILETIRITDHDLKSRLGIRTPRIAVTGLNPHAGEGGALGVEDEAIIVPAIEQLKAEGINCWGPLPADTMFHAAARATYDAAVCMYHDQALIPAKALAFDDSVNVTLGLPIVRTSPDHGTAFDIAGTGKANPASFIAALRMADKMSSGISS